MVYYRNVLLCCDECGKDLTWFDIMVSFVDYKAAANFVVRMRLEVALHMFVDFFLPFVDCSIVARRHDFRCLSDLA